MENKEKRLKPNHKSAFYILIDLFILHQCDMFRMLIFVQISIQRVQVADVYGVDSANLVILIMHNLSIGKQKFSFIIKLFQKLLSTVLRFFFFIVQNSVAREQSLLNVRT